MRRETALWAVQALPGAARAQAKCNTLFLQSEPSKRPLDDAAYTSIPLNSPRAHNTKLWTEGSVCIPIRIACVFVACSVGLVG